MTDPENSRLSKLRQIPDPASPPGQLAQALRELARAAGVENLRQLAERAHVALGVVSEALSGRPNRVPTKEVVEAICNACDADEPKRAQLQDLRSKAIKPKQRAPATDDPPPPGPAPGEAVDPLVSGSPAELVEDGGTDPHGGISQQDPERRWWWPRPAALVVVLSLALAGVAAWGINTLVNACGAPGSGVSRVDGECVGVTDGSYVFAPALADAEAKIAAENARVAGSGHTVTIALLNMMTVNNTSPVPLSEVVHQLEGAYTAQYRANHTNYLGDSSSPLIRLVLANEGSHENQWQPVVHQIKGMADDKDPLVAVTGLGVSVTQTEDGAKDLAAHHIPMVGAITTADELNYKNIPGFIRVAPSSADLVQGLSIYLQHRQEQQRQAFDSAILVYDTNSDDSGDLFTKSLRNHLSSGMSSLIKTTPPQGFTGTSGLTPGNPDLFFPTTSNICAVSAVKPPLILFAGRALDLRTFLQSLEQRICSDKPMTVLTANINLGDLDEAALERGNITVVNATASDPHGWANSVPVPGTPAHFGEFRSEFTKLGFDPAHLDDGDAIANHDALSTAIKAARLAAIQAPRAQNGVPKLVDVYHQMLNLNTQYVVPGASGDLTYRFDRFRDEYSGNPCNKPIPVLEVPPYKPPPELAGKPTQAPSPPYVTTCR